LLKGWTGPGIDVQEDQVRLNFPVETVEQLERQVLMGLHGMYQVVTQAPLPRRLYLDAGGSVPAIYCVRTGRIASSAHMLFGQKEYQDRFIADRYERLVAQEGHGWISGTLTAHADAVRLLPNHYLDLERLSAHRYWPHYPDFQVQMPLETAAQTIAAAIRGYVEACAREHTILITATAGFDSRILIAAARNVADRVSFVTFGQLGDGLDQYMAARMAQGLNLRHTLEPIIPADHQEQKRWDAYVGHCVREINRLIHPTLSAVSGDLMLTGMYGETGRSRLYRQDTDTINNQPATASFIVSRLTLPLDSELLRNIEKWLDPIRTLPRSAVLDLAFNELKFASWAMGQAPVQKAMKWSLMPFAQYQVQQAFMSVPPAVKGTSALFDRIGEILWPEAMSFPINRYGDWRDRFGKLAKITNREAWVRYLRDRRAGHKRAA